MQSEPRLISLIEALFSYKLVSRAPRMLRGLERCAVHTVRYRGTSLMRTPPPSQDRRRALGIGLLYGPRERRFLMSEVPLYANDRRLSLADCGYQGSNGTYVDVHVHLM